MVSAMPRFFDIASFSHAALRGALARARTTPGTLAFLPPAR